MSPTTRVLELTGPATGPSPATPTSNGTENTNSIAGLPTGTTAYVGDARDMLAIETGSVDLIVTSPPYWDLKKYGSKKSELEIGKSTYDEYLAQLNLVWQECYRCSADDAVLIINVNTRRVQKRFHAIPFDIAARMEGWELWDHVIWYVPNALPQPYHYMERLLDNKFESCLVFTKEGRPSYKFHKPRVPQKYIEADPRSHKKNSRGRCVGNILRIPAYRPPNIKQLGYHVAAFPEELVAFFIECYTDTGDRVLDPFLGSGTTLKVARTMGRLGVGYECHEEYAELIQERVNERWAVPDWRDIDILHSTSMVPGSQKTRKIHHHRAGHPNANGSDLLSERP